MAPYTDAERGTDGVPCSLNQEQMISIEMSPTDSQYYTQPLIFELAGDLNQPALLQALQMITARHEALRTRFITTMGSEPRQVVLPPGEVYMPLRIVHHPDANEVSSQPGRDSWRLHSDAREKKGLDLLFVFGMNLRDPHDGMISSWLEGC